MNLCTLEKHLKEMREQGATDDSKVYILDINEYNYIECVDFDGDDVILISE